MCYVDFWGVLLVCWWVWYLCVWGVLWMWCGDVWFVDLCWWWMCGFFLCYVVGFVGVDVGMWCGGGVGLVCDFCFGVICWCDVDVDLVVGLGNWYGFGVVCVSWVGWVGCWLD